VNVPVGRRNVEQALAQRVGPIGRDEDEWQKDAGGKERIEEKHGNHRIRLQRLFFEDVVEAKQYGRAKREN